MSQETVELPRSWWYDHKDFLLNDEVFYSYSPDISL